MRNNYYEFTLFLNTQTGTGTVNLYRHGDLRARTHLKYPIMPIRYNKLHWQSKEMG